MNVGVSCALSNNNLITNVSSRLRVSLAFV